MDGFSIFGLPVFGAGNPAASAAKQFSLPSGLLPPAGPSFAGRIGRRPLAPAVAATQQDPGYGVAGAQSTKLLSQQGGCQLGATEQHQPLQTPTV